MGTACSAPTGPATFPPRRLQGLLSPPTLTIKHKSLQQAELPVLPTFPLGMGKMLSYSKHPTARPCSLWLCLAHPAKSCCGRILTTPSAFPLIPLLPHLLRILPPQASLNPSLPGSFYAGPRSTAVTHSFPSSSGIQLSCAWNSSRTKPRPTSVASKSKDKQGFRAGRTPGCRTSVARSHRSICQHHIWRWCWGLFNKARSEVSQQKTSRERSQNTRIHWSSLQLLGMRAVKHEKATPRLSFYIFHKEQSHQTGAVRDWSVLGPWHSLLLANQPKGRSCPPLPLLSAVGRTWKGLHILHRERKANKMQWKCKKKKRKNKQRPSLN